MKGQTSLFRARQSKCFEESTLGYKLFMEHGCRPTIEAWFTGNFKVIFWASLKMNLFTVLLHNCNRRQSSQSIVPEETRCLTQLVRDVGTYHLLAIISSPTLVGRHHRKTTLLWCCSIQMTGAIQERRKAFLACDL